MDDTQQQNVAQPVTDNTMQPSPVSQDPAGPVVPQIQMQPMSSMGDLAGMTPPPAPMVGMSQDPLQQNSPVQPAPVMPTLSQDAVASPTPQMGGMDMSTMPNLSSAQSMPSTPTQAPSQEKDDYAYAEDLLDEILDSLDRIEAKLDAMDKKTGQ